MIAATLAWWVASSVLGLISLPLAWRLFKRLPDRGIGFSRALGLMAASYLLWISASFGLLRNTLGGAILAILILAGLSFWAGSGHWKEIVRWLRTNRKTVLVMEGLFLLAFVIWAFVRANNPALDHTEKPMELAFLNSIQRSEAFPPRDPWLSGYAISYYYFGYIQLSLLTTLTQVSGGVAFNLGNALWFGLSISGTYSLLYNLLTRQEGKPRLAAALFGPIFVLISGNLEGFLEVLHNRHLFWRQDAGGGLVSSFWEFLNVKTLVNPPMTSPTWLPTRHWWWWRASRVVNDVNLVGNEIEVIDEFPFFSFLLADNHPHLLALPFVLMGIGLALQIYLVGKREKVKVGSLNIHRKWLRWIQIGGSLLILLLAMRQGMLTAAEGQAFLQVFLSILRTALLGLVGLIFLRIFFLLISGSQPALLSPPEFWFGAWLFGGIIFLNTWDSPIYLSLFILCMWWGIRSSPFLEGIKETLQTVIALGVAAVLFYLPWYPSFSSQLGGVLPNLIFPTRLPQFLVMFAPAFVPILWWLILRVRDGWHGDETRRLISLTIGLPLVILLASWILAFVMGLYLNATDPTFIESALNGMGAASLSDLLVASLSRLWTGWTALALGLIFALGVMLLWRLVRLDESSTRDKLPVWPFVVMLVLIGALLIMGPEFVYLRDQFSSRMNTIFKFYFATWILWGLAAAYAVTTVWRWGWGLLIGLGVLLPLGPEVFHAQQLSRVGELTGRAETLVPWVVGIYTLGWILWVILALKAVITAKSVRSLTRPVLTSFIFLPLILGLFYPFISLWTKTNGFNPPSGRTLDGSAFVEHVYPSDYNAIQWIRKNLPTSVIVEASDPGASYRYYARISTHTGLPTVLGWPGHESQWRGGHEEMGSRQTDITTLYQSRDWNETKAILDYYGIDYVYVGPLEQLKYERLYEGKFEVFMDLVYQNDEVRIYARRGEARQ